jgi:hypothetical protein
MSKSTLTRRALVASTAAVPAAAALPLSAAVADPADAELLRLGAALDRIEQEWLVLHTADAKERAIVEAKIEAATGISLDNAPELTTENSEEGYWATRTKVVKEHPCEDPDLTQWGNVQDRLYPLADEILSLKASTPAGLAVQAKAVAFAAADLWDPVANEGDVHERLFIEAVCAFCNITPLPLRLVR